jgi:hypothetical protein
LLRLKSTRFRRFYRAGQILGAGERLLLPGQIMVPMLAWAVIDALDS